MEAKELLKIQDELNLYLVANGLKPASLISLDPSEYSLKNRVITKKEYRERSSYGLIKGKTHAEGLPYTLLEVLPEDIQRFRLQLNHLGIFYKDKEQEDVEETSDPEGNFREGNIAKKQIFSIASNKENLERLLSAKSDEELGLALGFPEESVKAYQKVIKGELRDGSYANICLAKAKQAGLTLPLWLAYISFLPEQLDFTGGNVSASSETLGKKYQHFLREHNSELAERIEQEFLQRSLPDSWEKRPDGKYVCTYRNPRVIVTK